MAFHAALQRGDRRGVVTLLAPEVIVTEGGETQSHDEYASHHLAEDIAFLKGAKITPISLRSIPAGDTAVVGSEADIGMMKQGRWTTTRSRELLKLKRQDTTWKIVSIEWQSELLGKPTRE
ncbi:MAG: nuclear transport factor 2 family protein [Dokdonella sp.]